MATVAQPRQEQQALNAHVRQRVLRALIVIGYQHAQRL